MSRPSMLFYNDWPLGYHNQEAERKARFFAARGHDVVWVTGVGTRNPRPSSAGKVKQRLRRELRPRVGVHPTPTAGADGVRSAGLLVAPPRQVGLVHRANVAWVVRQLRDALPDWGSAVAWIRHATPEVVEALDVLRPAVVVYEVVDAHHAGPGMVGPWLERFERAERRLTARADAVVVTNAPLAPRFEVLGAQPIHVPHGVDLFEWAPRTPARVGSVVAGFLGTLDGRLDVEVLRHVAAARPAWTLRLVGPVERGFDPAALADLPNVEVLPAVAHSRIGDVLHDFDVGVLAYADTPMYRGMAPLKLLELLAAGRGVVARPTPAMSPFASHVRFASAPEAFVEAIEAVVAEDTPELAAQRRAVAEQHDWGSRLEQLGELVDELSARAARA